MLLYLSTSSSVLNFSMVIWICTKFLHDPVKSVVFVSYKFEMTFGISRVFQNELYQSIDEPD